MYLGKQATLEIAEALAKPNCKHCYGRGTYLINEPNSIEWLQRTCVCVDNYIRKKAKENDNPRA